MDASFVPHLLGRNEAPLIPGTPVPRALDIIDPYPQNNRPDKQHVSKLSIGALSRDLAACPNQIESQERTKSTKVSTHDFITRQNPSNECETLSRASARNLNDREQIFSSVKRDGREKEDVGSGGYAMLSGMGGGNVQSQIFGNGGKSQDLAMQSQGVVMQSQVLADGTNAPLSQVNVRSQTNGTMNADYPVASESCKVMPSPNLSQRCFGIGQSQVSFQLKSPTQSQVSNGTTVVMSCQVTSNDSEQIEQRRFALDSNSSAAYSSLQLESRDNNDKLHSLRSASSPQLSSKPPTRSKVYRKASLKTSSRSLSLTEQTAPQCSPTTRVINIKSHYTPINSPLSKADVDGSCDPANAKLSRSMHRAHNDMATDDDEDPEVTASTRISAKHAKNTNCTKNTKNAENAENASKGKWNVEDVHITCNPLSTPYPYSTPCQKTGKGSTIGEQPQDDEPKSRSCGSFLPILSLIPQTVISFQYLSPKMKFSWWRNKIS